MSLRLFKSLTSGLEGESFAATTKMVGTSDDDISSCWTSETIKVYVGPKAKRYSVHEALLTRYEWFRKKVCAPSNITSQGSITLHAEDPKVFELLISWLYRKNLKAISTRGLEIALVETTLYVEMYLRACVWEIHELQNALMDQLRNRPFHWLPCTLVMTMYENSPSQSSLRSYSVDLFVHKVVKLNEDRREMVFEFLLRYGNQGFMLDYSRALLQLCTKAKIPDPDRTSGCVYHKHEEGEMCQS